MKPLKSIEVLFQGIHLRDADGAGEDWVNLAGGHPRTLENVHELLVEEKCKKDLEKLRFKELLNKLVDKCYSPMTAYWALGRQLLGAAICSVPVDPLRPILALSHNQNSDVLTVDQVRENGYCPYLLEQGGDHVIPVLTPLQVVRYFDQLSRMMAVSFKAALQSRSDQPQFCGKHFEYFHSHSDIYSRMFWVGTDLQRPEAVSIRQFYSRNYNYVYSDERDVIPLHDLYHLKLVSVNFLQYFVSSEGNIKGSAFTFRSFEGSHRF